MNEVVVRASMLTKVYRLYTRPHHRVLDIFGLLPGRFHGYTEHRALDGISLEIRRRERVAIIGRNGAGKSTLLKIVTGVTTATSGVVEVAQGAQALLQLGTGFHPDFTGRENAYSYLAHMGITGRNAEEKILEIVEFAELEEYIEQPIKTYSSGMVARLMFATSTAIAPRLLVLDEILGVGDAYFSHKSYERIKELCDKNGTTVLLVTHDIYSASNLCERMIWIDRGRIMIDGPSATVMKAYEDSIRLQEETRLRLKKTQQLEASLKRAPRNSLAHIRLEIATRNNLPCPAPVYFSRIALTRSDGSTFELPLADGIRSGISESHLDLADGCWGDPCEWHGRHSRPMLGHGSPFHRVSGTFVAADLAGPDAVSRIDVDYWMEAPSDLLLRMFAGSRSFDLGMLPAAASVWVTHSASINADGSIVTESESREVNVTGLHGSGDITITNISVLDASGRETFHLRHGEAATVLVAYQIQRPALREQTQVLLAFMRDGVQDICRVITRDLLFDVRERDSGTVRMHWERVPLAPGNYAISVMIARAGYYDQPQPVFYSINPEVYACLSRGIEIIVRGDEPVAIGTGAVIEGKWSLGDAHAENPQSYAQCLQASPGPSSDIKLDFPTSIASEFPAEFPLAWKAVQETLSAIDGVDLSALARHSPALLNFDWQTYLKLSVIRMVRAARALRQRVPEGACVLDFGAYFGNFSLMAAQGGHRVEALDSYQRYAPALDAVVTNLRQAGITVLEADEFGFDLRRMQDRSYDAVLLMGVLEHIAHTPRHLLESINRMIKPGGCLIMDTPNLAYIYNRQKLAEGQSIFCPIESQYRTEVPFEGHHREYVPSELEWMIQALGHELIESSSFNYSLYGSGTLSGRDAENFRIMESNPGCRELLFTVSRRPGP